MIRMMVTVVIFYALCWLPFHVITLAGDQNPEIYNQSFMPVLWVLFHWLAMSNSCYNPIIYCWMSPKFRAGLHLAFYKCCRRKHSKCESDEQIDDIGGNNGVVLRIEMQSMQNKKSKECRYISHREQLLSDKYELPGNIHSDTWKINEMWFLFSTFFFIWRFHMEKHVQLMKRRGLNTSMIVQQLFNSFFMMNGLRHRYAIMLRTGL